MSEPAALEVMELRLRDLDGRDAGRSTAATIDLRGPGVLTTKRARRLACATGLRELRLHPNCSTTRFALTALTKSKTLAAITIWDLIGGGAIGPLDPESRIKALHDNSHGMTGDDLVALAALPRLERLHAQGAKVTNAAAKALAAAPRLKALDLEGAAFAPRAIQTLARSETLEQLSLCHARLAREDLDALAASASLRDLDLWGTSVAAAELSLLGGSSRVESLTLGGVWGGPGRTGAETLAALDAFDRLERIWLDDVPLTARERDAALRRYRGVRLSVEANNPWLDGHPTDTIVQ
ncbi:MAG: hypothetical protein AAGF90_18275 [Pseudomonadota bacterium]